MQCIVGNVPPKADLGDLSGLAKGTKGGATDVMINSGEFDGAKAYKDSKVRRLCWGKGFLGGAVERDHRAPPPRHLGSHLCTHGLARGGQLVLKGATLAPHPHPWDRCATC